MLQNCSLSSLTPRGCGHCMESYSVRPYCAEYTATLECGLQLKCRTSCSHPTLLRNSSMNRTRNGSKPGSLRFTALANAVRLIRVIGQLTEYRSCVRLSRPLERTPKIEICVSKCASIPRLLAFDRGSARADPSERRRVRPTCPRLPCARVEGFKAIKLLLTRPAFVCDFDEFPGARARINAERLWACVKFALPFLLTGLYHGLQQRVLRI
ncbi:hypothetical protein EVAR_50698_1 [Eumeta japonica]|uniref:Uncharacterized protein n=1 Tax=Eumeta variegata TaxID=151549 RepID=A0A4C1YMR2_EUMVA|nr:hypothetical protein EVAR_50698_1 [Eumeta japonica]